MIIAVNTRLLLPGKIEGIGRFALETLRIITKDHPEHQFVFIFDRNYDPEYVFFSNITPVVGFPPARHPLLWYWFFEHSVPILLRKYKADLFLSPDGWLSLRSPIKSLPVIHDLNFYHLPEFIPFHIRQYYYHYFPRFIQKAVRIATVSEFTKSDITGRFNYDAAKVDVVFNGANSFHPVHEDEKQRIRSEFSQGAPYLVFVGLIHPRKNLTNLFLAYDRFRIETQSNVKLLIVGARKWWTHEMQHAYEQCSFRSDILFTGRVTDEQLNGIISSALAMAYVSHFEGFGIPVLESMYCDTPVICSSTSSMPEIGGQAVLYADPSDVESIKNGLVKLYKDPDLRNDLVRKARIQREKFTWEKTAGLLWESIEKCLVVKPNKKDT